MHEIAQPFQVDTPLGRGWVLFLEPSLTEHYWTVVLCDSRALVTLRQQDIRIARCYTLGVDFPHAKMKAILDGPEREASAV